MKSIKILLLFLLLIGFTTCEDIIEVNLSDFNVSLLAPTNGLSTTDSDHKFYWENLKGAEEYNLQIVSPRFSSISKFVLDTTITDNNFDFTLSPDEYEWRVKAINASSHTDYSVFNLTIGSK